MALKCTECGHIFEEGEQAQWTEMHGFDYGGGEEFSGCPRCHGEYEETTPCAVCGLEHTAEELFGGVCEKCIDSYRHDVNGCINVAREMPKEEIKINALLAYLFDEKDIEAILIERVKERMPDVNCSEFIDNDITWFGEQLVAQEAHL